MEYETLSTLTGEINVERLEIQAGDVLVFTAIAIPSKSRIDELKQDIANLFPDIKVLVLVDGLRLDQVLRRVDNESKT